MQRIGAGLGRCFAIRVLASLLAFGTVFVALVPETEAAAAKRDPREKQAKHAFAVGRFDEALELFASLYADTTHPTYLRNIGRCYQNLKQPDNAIRSFKDYLRRAGGLTVAEKAEIDDYIAEMEALKRRQEAAAPVAPEPAKPAAAAIAAPVPATPPQPATAGLDLTTQTSPAPSDNPSPFYKRAWFWGVVAGVVVVGVVSTLAATGAFSKSDPCSGRVCVNLGASP